MFWVLLSRVSLWPIGGDADVCVAAWQSRCRETVGNHLPLALLQRSRLNRVANCFCHSLDGSERAGSNRPNWAARNSSLVQRGVTRVGKSLLLHARVG